MGSESLRLYLSSMACVRGPGPTLGQPEKFWEQWTGGERCLGTNSPWQNRSSSIEYMQ